MPSYIGTQLRRAREEMGLTQTLLAGKLMISNSYLSQIESNQRPLSMRLLLRANEIFGINIDVVSAEEHGRLGADLWEALSENAPQDISASDVRDLLSRAPSIARAVVASYQRERQSAERAALFAARLGEDPDPGGVARAPFERVRDFFYARRNHIATLDHAAERLYVEADLAPRQVRSGLAEWLRQRHGIRVIFDNAEKAERRYRPVDRTLHISPFVKQGQQAFQMATQLAHLEASDVIEALIAEARMSNSETGDLLRIGLAQYFAGAVLLPYGLFFAAAERFRYDIDKLGRHFGVGYETICHRLSTLQRPGSLGVPFFFVRVDRAGNISKRQSATDFHFSRVGGSCPLWNVYEAFAQPRRILTQIAQMPDGRTYLWIARTVGRPNSEFGDPGKAFAIGLGCDIKHAARLVYSKGLDIDDMSAATPIGAGCKVCERTTCPQRAFPSIGRTLVIDRNRSAETPYPTM